MTIWAMLLAAGHSTRIGGSLPKQFLSWQENPLYWASAKTFAGCAKVNGLIFVFPAEYLEEERKRLAQLGLADLGLPWIITAGGKERSDSVRLGLDALDQSGISCDALLIHDTARPFVTPALITRVANALTKAEGVVPGVPVTDTIKEVEESALVDERLVCQTLDRSRLMAVQTPQGFLRQTLRQAHDKALAEHWTVTDDASLLERCGKKVLVVLGDPANKKITSPQDLTMIQDKTPFLPCTGWGYDVHKFAEKNLDSPEARPLRLGGVLIPNAPEILAHSDGDVLLHALMDALLGCCAEGDIGQWFPDSNPAYEACDSAVMLDDVLRLVQKKHLQITHLDMTIITQIPKIAPHRDAIRKNVAHLTGLDLHQVSLKATTEEGLGFTGEKKGLKAVVVASALHKNS